MPTCNSHKSDSGKRIQSNDCLEFVKSHDHVLTYLQAILTDCSIINPLYGRTGFLRDMETLSRRFQNEGLAFACKTLPSFFDSLLDYLETGVSAYPSFRIRKGHAYPVFLQQLTSPIYSDPTSEHAVLCMKLLYQFCAAFKKLKGPYKQRVLIEQLDKFVTTDSSFDFDKLSEHDLCVLVKARHLISKIVEGLNPFDPSQSELFTPRPGPGATNRPTKKCERYRPHVLYTQLAEAYDYDEWFSSTPLTYKGSKATLIESHVTESGLQTDGAIEKMSLLTSRFKFVHKTYGKPRCICIEEYETQWLQQSLRRALYSRVESSPHAVGINFTDQSLNGLLARLGSRRLVDHNYCTIDMSEGSDRIFRSIVEYLFADNKELLKALMCLSTRVIELPKDVPYHRKYLFAKKFAPMGSAICFPVMALVHYALIKAIISSIPNTPHMCDIPTYVYGDDIIVESKYAEAVYEGLPRFGMKINRNKSFYKSAFRESCGVHAYNGHVITPTRFKSIVSMPLSVNKVVTALEDEGALFKKGFKVTAELIRSDLHKFKDVRASALPVVGPKSAVLGYIREDKVAADFKSHHFLKRRWSARYQSYLYKARVIHQILNGDDMPPLTDNEYYLRWMVLKTQAFKARTIEEQPKDDLTVRWVWVPGSAFYHA